MKITDAYHCASLGGVSQAGLVGMTARGFNVFKRQAIFQELYGTTTTIPPGLEHVA